MNISNSELCIFYVFHNLQVNVRKKTHAARKLFSFHIISMAKNNRIVFSFITNENESSFLLEYIPLMGNVWVCRVTWTTCVQVSFHLSRFGFLGLAGDRYLAIVHPLKYRDLGKTKNGWTAVLILLMITVIINIPYPMYINDAETGKKRTSLSLPFLENVVAMSWKLNGCCFCWMETSVHLSLGTQLFCSENVSKTTANVNNIIATNLYCLEFFRFFFEKSVKRIDNHKVYNKDVAKIVRRENEKTAVKNRIFQYFFSWLIIFAPRKGIKPGPFLLWKDENCPNKKL